MAGDRIRHWSDARSHDIRITDNEVPGEESTRTSVNSSRIGASATRDEPGWSPGSIPRNDESSPPLRTRRPSQ